MKQYFVFNSYMNYKGGINNRSISRIVNQRLETVRTFRGKNAQVRANRIARKMNTEIKTE